MGFNGMVGVLIGIGGLWLLGLLIVITLYNDV